MSNLAAFEIEVRQACEKAIGKLLADYDSGALEVKINQVKNDAVNTTLQINIEDLQATKKLPHNVPYRAKFQWKGREYEVFDYVARQRRYPWHCKRLCDGKVYRFTHYTIRSVVPSYV